MKSAASKRDPGLSREAITAATNLELGTSPKGAGNTTLDLTSKYARYCFAVAEARLAHPEYRRGQAHFNVLYFGGFDPEFADEIRGTDVDPFYNDAQVERMLPALARRWRGQ